MEDEDVEGLRANVRFLVQELERRRVDVSLIDYMSETFLATYQGHTELLVDIDSSLVSYPASTVANHKHIVKKILRRQGLSVNDGERFPARQSNEAVLYARALGYPVVAKPCVGSGGREVQVDLFSMSDVEHAIDSIYRHCGPAVEVLIEKQFEGREYRVFITRDGDYAVVYRDPAHVIGDGARTIEAIAIAESYRRMNPRKNCLAPIVLDAEAVRHLAHRKRTVKDVPALGEKVYVRGNSNVTTGASCDDATEEVHMTVIELSKKALDAFPGLPYVGVDFMTRDVRAPQTAESYRIIELNTNPAIGMHINPGSGKQRHVERALADMIFPETKSKGAATATGSRPALRPIG